MSQLSEVDLSLPLTDRQRIAAQPQHNIKCEAITWAGHRCTFNAVFEGLCVEHFRKSRRFKVERNNGARD
jgi:hypothetical protein